MMSADAQELGEYPLELLKAPKPRMAECASAKADIEWRDFPATRQRPSVDAQ
jgi:hypothetical protein